MDKKFTPKFSMVAKSATECDMLLYGPIGDSWWSDGNGGKKFVQDFKTAEAKYDRINIRINSPGGSVDEGLPMITAIKASKKDIHTYNDGTAYSMGAMILLAGKTVHAAKGSITMLHNVSGGCMGNAKDLRKTADNMDVYDETLGQMIADKTGKTLAQVKTDWFNYDDHFMTAKTANDHKLVDVVEDYATEPMPENLENLNAEQVMAFYDPAKQPATAELDLAAITAQVEASILHKLKTENMSLFGSKYPKLEALKGKKPADITDEDVAGVFAELKEAGFEVVMLRQSDVDEAGLNATAITDALTAANAALGEGKKPTLKEAVAAMAAQIVDLSKKVEEYGEQAGALPTNAATAAATAAAAAAAAAANPALINGLPVDPKFNTSFDAEQEARNKILHKV